MINNPGTEIEEKSRGNCSQVDCPVCEIECIHPEVKELISRMVPLHQAQSLADLFKTLSDVTRVRIIDVLAQKELCVCDLAELLGMSQSAVSHQLRLLRSSHLVKYRREGKMIYYSLDDHHVSALYRQGMEHINEPE